MTKPYKVLDLFSGVGGFSLGLDRTGAFRTVAFCEKDEKCHRVLRKHWPHVPIYTDVRELTLGTLQADGIVPDVIVGGFPCQDISAAGRGEGIIGERSGLWSEMFRLIRDVRPTWAIIENVRALSSRGLTLVLQNLNEIGYCAEWNCIPVSSLGGPHERDRIFVVAYPDKPRLEGRNRPILHECASKLLARERSSCEGKLSDCWETDPHVLRVADGVPNRVDRIKQVGNSVCPQLIELLGRAIIEADMELSHAG
jgi:DNA (cytosine-5)-methyltransferase 1